MLNVDTPSVVRPSARKGTYTVLGYDRSRGGLTANARQKSALRLLAASKETGYVDLAGADYVLDTTGSDAAQHRGSGSRCHSTRWQENCFEKVCSAAAICRTVQRQTAMTSRS